MNHDIKKDYNLELIRTISIFLVVLIHFCNYYIKTAEPEFNVNYSAWTRELTLNFQLHKSNILK